MKSQYNTQLQNLSNAVAKIAPQLPYHNYIHSLDVADVCGRRAIDERVGEDGIYHLKSAGYLHDIIVVPDKTDNEEQSVKFANKILPQFGYSAKSIDIISRLIMATKQPTNPSGILEMIICDADIDNIGRDDFFECAEKCRIEMGKSNEEWYGTIVPKFLAGAKFYTTSAQKERNAGLKSNIEKIRQMPYYKPNTLK